MNDNAFIAAVRELRDDHAACDPSEWCSLQSDLNQLVTEHDQPVVAAEPPLTCHVIDCRNRLTVADPGLRCRQCVLQDVR